MTYTQSKRVILLGDDTVKRMLTTSCVKIRAIVVVAITLPTSHLAFGHGTAVSPISRVRLVYESNPESPNFPLAANAVALDGTSSYYTWNEVSRNIPQAVTSGLPEGFDYSPWIPDGQLGSAGRVDPSNRTYLGLDQVSSDWPTTPVDAGSNLSIDFLATAPHDPSVWDVWMTTPDWTPDLELNWGQMEFLGRPDATLTDLHYQFDVNIPADRSGHHVIWIAWQRDDPVGEVFISTSDVMVSLLGDFDGSGTLDCADIDAMVMSIADQTPQPEFDLNGDGNVDGGDVSTWLDRAGSLPGDANLDGVTDVSDFNVWNTNKFNDGTGWCSGDFSVDGFVDVSDFNIWNTNKFQSAAMQVPEPAVWPWLVVVWVFLTRSFSLVPSRRTCG